MAKAKPKETYVRNAKVNGVVDGDTVDLQVDLGCDISINMRCRLDGINAPEKNTDAGKTSKAWVEKTLPVGTAVVVQTVQDKQEKYGRYLATVFLPNTAKSINDQLIEQGLAKPYHGEART
ncbi:putative Nuclease (SNase domain-containing protein) [Ralstonia phage RP31]|uniref:Putative nuclease (SNase domain-containing protein) n=2 Tax=Ripduovirus RP12 TaxID=2560700 RepID=A0A1L7N173_9CAUD|nr:endonuclease [Ralstonia phage RP12]BAW19227.1 putative nuclease (SNase domain-containing protein) [Ralstonia phage RP12]BAW19513.1 putative Nuclease (SNase domain-containing protein) [Ralstonia phage RP31]